MKYIKFLGNSKYLVPENWNVSNYKYYSFTKTLPDESTITGVYKTRGLVRNGKQEIIITKEGGVSKKEYAFIDSKSNIYDTSGNKVGTVVSEAYLEPVLLKITVTYNVAQADTQVTIVGSNPSVMSGPQPSPDFDKIEIDDGTVIDSPMLLLKHTFSTSGIHNVIYTLKQGRTEINYGALNIGHVESIILPEGLTTVNYSSLPIIDHINSFVFPSTVVHVDGDNIIFNGSSTNHVDGVYIEGTSVVIPSNTVATVRTMNYDVSTGVSIPMIKWEKIYVPANLLEDYKTANVWSDIAGRIYPIPEEQETPPTPSVNNNGHEYVDLGLPSGTLWATMNVGALNITDYGDYYSYEGNTNELEDPISLAYDTAARSWGGQWRMPTKVECEELVDNTIYQWVTDYLLSGINGATYTANGLTLFIPAGGFLDSFASYTKKSEGLLSIVWTATPNGLSDAYYFSSDSSDQSTGTGYGRSDKYLIRPVIG